MDIPATTGNTTPTGNGTPAGKNEKFPFGKNAPSPHPLGGAVGNETQRQHSQRPLGGAKGNQTQPQHKSKRPPKPATRCRQPRQPPPPPGAKLCGLNR